MAFQIRISTGSSVPIYRQIRDRICEAIRAGDLREGDQVPSVRILAEELVVNPNTVARTYGELIREGILEGRQGKGVFVARRRPIYTKAERLRRIGEPLEALVNEALLLGFDPGELRALLDERLRKIEGPGR
jgi:GntR family transcriptional regulator